MQLRDCKYCRQTISTTAIYCPACRKSDEVSVNFLNSARKTAWATAIFGMALVGPNAIAGAFLGTEMNRPTARTIRKIASKIGAIDSVSGGLEYTVFFTRTGFVPMLLYDLGRNPNIPTEIPYADFIATHTEAPNAQGEVNGYVEYRTPTSYQPPRRPKPRERLLLGRDLYEQLTEQADHFDKFGPPQTLGAPFSFSGKHAVAYAQLLGDKFDEYVQPTIRRRD